MRYFSFSTLTTVGYGDIVPRSNAARTLAELEAITGQIYLAVLVARLVGLHIVDSSGSRSREE
jgi:voltage-gated potassium channel Kch